MRGSLWFGLYLVLVLMPLGLALVVDPIAAPRPFLLEVEVALGFIAFAVIVFEFSLVARIRGASEPFGTDALMLFHRQMGLAGVALVVGHAALAGIHPRHGATVEGAGVLALTALLVLVVSSISRRRLRIPYEAWLVLHRVTALVVVAAMLAHALAVGGYTRAPAVSGILGAYAALLLGLMLHYRVVRVLALRRRPWEVIANRDEGGDTRTLVVRPLGHPGLGFAPGQFAWLLTGPSPLRAQQHPISMASSAEPAPGGAIEFSIKALGDWSREEVPAVVPGTRLWIDGPYGAFTPDRVPGQGFVLIAGGIGITPMRSILLTLRDRGDVRPVVLIYATHDPSREIYGADFARLERELALRVVRVHEVPSPGVPGERGVVTAELLRRHLPPHHEHFQFFVCGPGPMMDALEDVVVELGIAPERFHTERFDLV